uniref:Uncharacterized protein n=1 Tax=Grammatophora oceanica TaxID=210454 RepID=A0A7S1YIZ4_9STRA|mmetsp:Transcript_49165/g.73310  ORF Transcript_49165/g.73310 Transcript_49165/m.73310 type:complete len:132 (+) Transcript_49165:3-398(+)|eukprot:CAMPEP_0194041002 /NCGR_PEP_ID=MMETSP0009_2-20130614/12919_1 /TAXON_ID=210454 /ORGANISM="Grammatophora oceanica, Strain CCMP 410" /LENGTH=131 /DNA_ID=CAMNT_0038684319 /DNA_START=41 /DNA_END=436 /DNA_ORIENTATION=+
MTSAPFPVSKILLGIFAGNVLFDSWVVMQTHDWWAVGRILVETFIMLEVIRGRLWAKNLLTFMLGLFALALVMLIVVGGSKLETKLKLGSGALAIYNLGIVLYFLKNKRFLAYMEMKQQPVAGAPQPKKDT